MMNNNNGPKLMVIGLDGATFDVLEPLLAQGLLPNLQKLIASGARGTLKSIIPPVTGPAWVSLATGKNPGKTGAFDFLNLYGSDYNSRRAVGSSHMAGHTFWDFFNVHGLKVGILNYPNLVPTYPINGFMVSGMGTSTWQKFTYPADLRHELDRVSEDYWIELPYNQETDLDVFISDLLVMLDKRLKAAKHLLTTRHLDLFLMVFSASDIVQHAMWRYWDPTHLAYDSTLADIYRPKFIEIWKKLDQAVGEVARYLDDGGHLFIVSDHGFGASDQVFYVNSWLESKGHLVRRRGAGSLSNRLRQKMAQLATPFAKPLMTWLLNTKAHKMLRSSILREIDLAQTKAFALESTDVCGLIYINRHCAVSQGVDEETFVEQTRRELFEDLRKIGGEINGLSLTVYRSADIYTGEQTKFAPDILISANDFRCSVSHELKRPIFQQPHFSPLASGTHRMDGVLIVSGPNVRPITVGGSSLLDIAPTLLYMLGLPIPADMDGCVLETIFQPEYLQKHPIEQMKSNSIELEFDVAERSDEEALVQRLRDLGYME